MSKKRSEVKAKPELIKPAEKLVKVRPVKGAKGGAAKAGQPKPKMTPREVKKILRAAIDIAGANGVIAKLVRDDPIGEVEMQAHKLRVLLNAILRPQAPAGKKSI
jgi:hypothetical protein